MTEVALIQCRLGSQRLPRKILMQVKEKVLITYCLERASMSDVDYTVVICPKSDYCPELHRALGWNGEYLDVDELDVARRFALALEKFPCKRFVRLCGDSPLIDPALIDAGLALARITGAPLVHNPSYPHGQQVEVIDTQYFLEREPQLKDREHVTADLYTNAKYEEIVTLNVYRDMREDKKLSVDSIDDFYRIERIIKAMERDHTEYNWRQVCALA